MNVWLSKPYQAYFDDPGPHGSDNQYNLWDATQDETQTWLDNKTVVKTVYDPCPAGFSVPREDAYTYFSTNFTINVVGSFSKGYYFKKNSSDATGSYWPASGSRDDGLAPDGAGTTGLFWSASASSIDYGYSLFFCSGDVYPESVNNRYYGLSVRPAVCSAP